MARRFAWLEAGGFVALSLLLVRALWVVPYLPTNDGPESVFAVHMQNHYQDAGTVYRDVFLPTTQFASSGFTLLYGPLEEWLGWEAGLRAALAIIVLLTAWGFVALVHAAAPRRLPLAFLGFPLALSWGLYMGFFAFTMGSGLGLFVLALAVRWQPPSGISRLIVAVLLLFQASCHVFSAVLTGLVVAVVLVARAPRGQRLRELSVAVLMGLPAVGVLVLSVISSRGGAQVPFADSFVLLPLSVSLPSLFRVITPGPMWRAVIVAVVVAASIVVGVARLPSRQTSVTDRALIACGLFLVFAGVFGPIHVPGWQFFSQRFVPLGVALCLLGVPVERLRWANLAPLASAALLVACAASLVVSGPFHKRLAAASADAIAGLSAPVRRHGFWLPVMLSEQAGMPIDPRESEVPYLLPLLHISGLYATVQGGVVPYAFVTSAATNAFVLRGDTVRPPPVPTIQEYWTAIESDAFATDPAYRLRIDDELATYGMFYEGVVVVGASAFDLAAWRARGYVAEWQASSVLVGHFVPCPLDVTLSGVSPDSQTAPLVDVGVGLQTIFRDEKSELTRDPEGLTHLLFPRAPCGDVWVRPHWDERRPDGVHKRYCANAGTGGDIRAVLRGDSARVACEVAAAP